VCALATEASRTHAAAPERRTKPAMRPPVQRCPVISVMMRRHGRLRPPGLSGVCRRLSTESSGHEEEEEEELHQAIRESVRALCKCVDLSKPLRTRRAPHGRIIHCVGALTA
jgi:hypothetical protein